MKIAGLILIGIGIIFWFLAFLFRIIGKRSGKKSAVEGCIIDMCFDNVNFNMGGSGNIRAGIMGTGDVTNYYPVFSYTINGVEYKRAGNISYNRGRLKKKIGQTCMVYYDPKNPQKASLSKNSAFTIISRVFMPVGFGLFILGMIFLSIR